MLVSSKNRGSRNPALLFHSRIGEEKLHNNFSQEQERRSNNNSQE
jgi:hypothetical protein